MDKVEVKFSYGAMSEILEHQANKQGFTLGKKAEHIEKLNNARLMLGFHVLTDSQDANIANKIHRLTLKNLKPLKG